MMLFLISEVFKNVYLTKQYIMGSFPLPKSMPLNSEGFLRMKNSISMHPMSEGKMSSPVVKSIDGLSSGGRFLRVCVPFSPLFYPPPSRVTQPSRPYVRNVFLNHLPWNQDRPADFAPTRKRK